MSQAISIMVRSLTKVSPDKTALPRHAIRIAATEKKIGEDEFMAAAIGDVDWLKHTLKPKKGTQSQMMNFDQNVRVQSVKYYRWYFI